MSAEEMVPQEGNDEETFAAAMQDDRYSEMSGDQLSEAEERLFDLVVYLVQGIVAHPDEVEVEEFLDDVGSVYAVRVHPDDVGRVIGKEGRVANALRQVVKAAATKTGARVTIEIITEDSQIEIVNSDDLQDEAQADEAVESGNDAA